VHLIFAVKYRESLIHRSWDEHLHKYISGIIKNKGHKLIVINGVEDHIHILFDLKPAECLSDLVREIKKASTGYVNQMRFTAKPFQWQNGYGAFCVCRKHRDSVIRYINIQKEHHAKESFKSEFLHFL